MKVNQKVAIPVFPPSSDPLGVRSLLEIWRLRAYAHVGLSVPPRPLVTRTSSPGSYPIPPARNGCVPFLPGPRGFRPVAAQSELFFPVAVSFRVSSPSGFIHFSTSQIAFASASHRVLSPSAVPDRCGFTRTATSGHRRLQGLVTLLAPSSPQRTSREFFVPVRPWGSPLQGLFFLRVARTSRPEPTFVTLSLRATNFSKPASSRSHPEGNRHPPSAFSATTGRCPRGVVPLRGLQAGLRAFRRTPSQASAAGVSVKSRLLSASQGHQPAGRNDFRRSRPP